MTQPGDVPPGAGPPGTAVRDSLVGRTLAGRYRVVRKLGEGGMASVYVAQHATLGKYVALKILHPHMARRGEIVERFLREAKAASRIHHINVIAISDFGTTPEGLVFFAMELLDGLDLFEELTEAKRAGTAMPWPRIRRIAVQVCAALAAAHEQGVIHRDLKPENIYLVTGVGGRERVVLLDFGIAKVTESRSDGRKLTSAGMLFGTPEYMSPEQAQGRPVDHRADIYAFGCLLFQLVSGTVPFEGDSPIETLQRHIHAPPPPLGEALAAVGAPSGLERVIRRALAKDPDRRYQTIRELGKDIRALARRRRDGSRAKRATGPAPAQRVPAGTDERAAPAEEKAEILADRAAAIAAGTGDHAVAAASSQPPSQRPSRRRWPWVALAAALGLAVAAVFVATGGAPAWGRLLGASGSSPADDPAPVVQAAPPGSALAPSRSTAPSSMSESGDAGRPAVAAAKRAQQADVVSHAAPAVQPRAGHNRRAAARGGHGRSASRHRKRPASPPSQATPSKHRRPRRGRGVPRAAAAAAARPGSAGASHHKATPRKQRDAERKATPRKQRDADRKGSSDLKVGAPQLKDPFKH